MFRNVKLIAAFAGKIPTLNELDEEYEFCLKSGDYSTLFEASKLIQNHEQSPEELWRKIRAIRLFAVNNTKKSSPEQKQLIDQAYIYSKTGLEIGPENWACNKWYAIMLGDKSEFEGSKAQLLASPDMKTHFGKAAELNPNDATCQHLVGLWCFSFANMSWMTRKVAGTIFAKVPESSYEEALSYFERAERLEPDFYSKNWLHLAKCYKALGMIEEFGNYRKKLLEFQPVDAEDRECQEEAKRL